MKSCKDITFDLYRRDGVGGWALVDPAETQQQYDDGPGILATSASIQPDGVLLDIVDGRPLPPWRL